MTTTESFDLIVIGSGPAGEKGAAQAAWFGKRVAVIEQQPRGGIEQRPGIGPLLRQRSGQFKCVADSGRRFVARDRAAWHRVEELRELVHEAVADLAERRRVHRERGVSRGGPRHRRGIVRAHSRPGAQVIGLR